MGRHWPKALGLLLVMALAAPAQAQSLEEAIVAQLRAQGFVEFEVSQTLLGRLRIVAVGPDYRREIVINPSSGEILRDYVTTIAGDTRVPVLVAPSGSGDDDDPDDDRADDSDDGDAGDDGDTVADDDTAADDDEDDSEADSDEEDDQDDNQDEDDSDGE